VWSYPVDVLHDAIEATYKYVAQSSPSAHPVMDPFAAAPDTLGAFVNLIDNANKRRIRARTSLDAQYMGTPTVDWSKRTAAEKQQIAALDPVSRAAYLAKRFYDRPTSRSSKDAKGNAVARPRPEPPKLDFHERVALLGDHAYLLRRLGLVIDLVVPARGVAAQGLVKVIPDWGGAAGWDSTPATAYEISGARFAPRPQGPGSDIKDGVLRLDDTTRFATIQGEPDGDAMKVIDFASNMKTLVGKLAQDSANAGQQPLPPREPLPARRTTGFLVTRKGREASLASRFTAVKAINTGIESGAPAPLFADDLHRGHRVDVSTNGGPWVSLQRRRTNYFLGAVSPVPVAADVADEGYVKATSATSDSDPSGPPDMYVHEALFGWEGWSLAAPRPGRSILPVYATDDQMIDKPSTPPSDDFKIDARARVEPGSLPSLRFGQQYSFRARFVDLAGNSVRFDDPAVAALAHASPPQPYKRYEPIAPPTIVLRSAVTEGESVEHLVIRSGEGLSADAYADYLNTQYPDPKFPEKVYYGFSDRHVAPPKTSQAMAEAHGAFDKVFSAGANRKLFYRLGTREEGTFMDTQIVSLDVDDVYDKTNPNGAKIITPPQVPLDQRRQGPPGDGTLTTHRGDPLAPGEYVICEAANVTVPYLPDVPAGGCVFYDPTTNADVIAMPTWSGSWPERGAFRIRLLPAGADGSTPLEKQVHLPPATILKLRYASLPALDCLEHMAYWKDYAPADDAKKGRHWMMTPYREITLVHAVPRPITPPTATLTLSRGFGETFVNHTGVLQCHSRSTGHVDMDASWYEYLDLPTKALPNDVIGDADRPALPQTGHAYQITAPYGQDANKITRVPHELGDTKHRRVTYTPVGTTRYREYFPADLIADTANITRAGTAPGPLADQSFSIPSSAKPLAPKIAYVVPTFKWEMSADGKTSTRRGGGLRIYMERPWYSSGEGEQLAVVLKNAANGADTTAFTSQWGRDPIWDAKAQSALVAASFKNADASVTALSLAEVTNGTCDVVAFDVEFNADRKLWMCDIEMEPGATYFPFVSLALARYQKESLKGLELSSVVRADFAQLTADRSLKATVFPQSVSVSIGGAVADNKVGPELPALPSIPSNGLPVGPVPKSHRFVAYVQERQPGSVGEMGWTNVGGVTEFGGQMLWGIAGAWGGTVPLPTVTTPGAERRLVVEEREYYEVDPGLFIIPGVTPASYRLVYVDTVALP
jgi:hypothetical protein